MGVEILPFDRFTDAYRIIELRALHTAREWYPGDIRTCTCCGSALLASVTQLRGYRQHGRIDYGISRTAKRARLCKLRSTMPEEATCIRQRER